MKTVAKSTFIRARVEPHIKREAEHVLHALGINTTSAVTMFLKQVSLHKGMPFEIKIPNKTTRAALTEKLDKRTGYKDANQLMADILAGR